MNYREELKQIRANPVIMSEEVKARMNKRLKVLAYFMFESGIIRGEIERISH